MHYSSTIDSQAIVVKSQTLERIADRTLQELNQSFHANWTKCIITQIKFNQICFGQNKSTT